MTKQRRFNPYGPLVYNGDWYSRLLNALKSVDENTSVPQVRTAAFHLIDLLAKHDECIHSVTATAPLPEKLDPAYVLSCVEDPASGDAVRVTLVEPRSIALTLTTRGSRDFVESQAKCLLESGISYAKMLLSMKLEW